VTSDFHGTTLGWSGERGVRHNREAKAVCDDCLRVTIRETSRGYSTILDCLLSFFKNSQTGLFFKNNFLTSGRVHLLDYLTTSF
jgi:hypothetical protein